MNNNNFPLIILSEQREMLEDELTSCEGEERNNTEQKLAETITAIDILKNFIF